MGDKSKMGKHNCPLCGWSSGWTMTKHVPPRINPNFAGHCNYPEQVIAAHTPMSARQLNQQILPKHAVDAFMGADCPCWKPQALNEDAAVDLDLAIAICTALTDEAAADETVPPETMLIIKRVAEIFPQVLNELKVLRSILDLRGEGGK